MMRSAGIRPVADLQSLEDVRAVPQHDIGASIDGRMRQADLRRCGMVCVFDPPMERRHDDVSLLSGSLNSAPDDILGRKRHRWLVIPQKDSFRKELAEADERHSDSVDRDDRRKACLWGRPTGSAPTHARALITGFTPAMAACARLDVAVRGNDLPPPATVDEMMSRVVRMMCAAGRRCRDCCSSRERDDPSPIAQVVPISAIVPRSSSHS